jgi:hypothetical protein
VVDPPGQGVDVKRERAIESDWERFELESRERQFTLEEFRSAVYAGAFRTIRLQGTGVNFFIEGDLRNPLPPDSFGQTSVTLAKARTRRPRGFRNPTRALELLWQMGVKRVEIQMQYWTANRVQENGARRPDMGVRLRRAHEAARLEALEAARLKEAETLREWEAERATFERVGDGVVAVEDVGL